MKERKTIHYVDNTVFLQDIKDYKVLVKKAEAIGDPLPKHTNKIGRSLIDISVNLAKAKNFSGYPFKEEMINDGIENAVKAIDSFNPDKYDNPHAYFTRVIYWAFVRRIQKEKKALYTKFKYIEKALIDGKPVAIGYDTEYMKVFIRDYEIAQEKKKQKALDRATLKFEEDAMLAKGDFDDEDEDSID